MLNPDTATPTLHLARWTVTSGSQVQSRGAVVIASGDHQWEASAEGNASLVRSTSTAVSLPAAALKSSADFQWWASNSARSVTRSGASCSNHAAARWCRSTRAARGSCP